MFPNLPQLKSVVGITGVAPPDYDEATAGTISIVTTTPKVFFSHFLKSVDVINVV